jgi:transcriptional regulator with XRE-family HTH domain
VKPISTFGRRLKQYRLEEAHATGDELAATLGTFRQTLSEYEREERFPRIDVLIRYAEILRVNPMWLLGFDVSMKPDRDDDSINVTHYSPTKRAIIDSIDDISESDALAFKQLLGRISKDEDGRSDL